MFAIHSMIYILISNGMGDFNSSFRMHIILSSKDSFIHGIFEHAKNHWSP